jgi:dihydrofolate reductase
MAMVIADISMSLDGFAAGLGDEVSELHRWFSDGDVEVPMPAGFTIRTSAGSAGYLQEAIDSLGALITGRRTFEIAGAWGGNHPMGVQTFVVTHAVPEGWPRPDASMTFVLDGVESAVAQAKEHAGDRTVAVASPSIVRQCLTAGLLDGISVNIVPVLLGDGIPLFAELVRTPIRLSGPEVTEGAGVIHLFYRVEGRA